MDKPAARRECFSRIKAIPPGEKAQKSTQIVTLLAESDSFQKAQVVFSYLALASEPNLNSLQEKFPEKTWAFSRVGEEGERLTFHKVSSADQLLRGEFGFLEPDPARCPELKKPDLALVPGVGFDGKNGARLGRGKGHYDRFLGPLRQTNTSFPVVGVCFSTQLLDLIPEPHDVPMDQIVSESGWAR